MSDQILTYPHGIKYQLSGWDNQVKQGLYGSIPCDAAVHAATSNVTEADGELWWGDNVGQWTHSFSSADKHPFNQVKSLASHKGLHWWINTSENKFQRSRWFDIGAEGNRKAGLSVRDSARSSWLREVTAVWFLFNGHDTTQNRDCYARVEKVGIRYRDPRGYVRIKPVTEKLGDLRLNEGVRGSSKHMFGYMLPGEERVKVVDNKYHFLGLRVQIKLRRGGTGANTDTLQGGISAIRLGLGSRPDGSYNTTNKRALVGRGNCTWSEFNENKLWLETR